MSISWSPGFAETLRFDHVTEARAQNDGNLRPNAFYFRGKFQAGQLRHGLIGNDQMIFCGLSLKGFQGRRAAGMAVHLIAQMGQKLGGHLDNGLLVVHQQNGFQAAQWLPDDRSGLLRSRVADW